MTEPFPPGANVPDREIPLATSWCTICGKRLQRISDGRHFRLWCRVCKKMRRGRSAVAVYPLRWPGNA